jgi:hypothetical protein
VDKFLNRREASSTDYPDYTDSGTRNQEPETRNQKVLLSKGFVVNRDSE